MNAYRLLRPLLFATDPERAHDLAIRAGEIASASPRLVSLAAARLGAADARLRTRVAGIDMATPIGLAAGFDKNARAVPFLAALGFGHVEVGSVSADASAGNPRPRLFRLPSQRAIVVNYGLPNDGAGRVAERLGRARGAAALGVNVVSTNHGPGAPAPGDDDVIRDYVRTARRMRGLADYLCLNLSCPNTREGRGFFHDRGRLRALLAALADDGVDGPVFLKVAPFADAAELDSLLEAADPWPFVAGFSINLPPGKPAGLAVAASTLARMPGAVSGRPCAAAADRAIAELARRIDTRRHAVIGSGGVLDAADAYRKIRLGASLVQVLTALVYEGPAVVRSINRGLAALAAADGFQRIADAVGVDARRPAIH